MAAQGRQRLVVVAGRRQPRAVRVAADLHPAASGRVYAAYGGVYVTVAIFWLWWADQIKPSRWDLLGAGLCLTGMAVIMFAPRTA